MADIYNVQHPCFKEKGTIAVTSPYGSRVDPITGKEGSFHAGLDSTLWKGTYGDFGTIVSFADGKVTTVYDGETSNKTYKNSAGNHVIIDHGNGYTTRYYHLANGVTKYTKVGAVVKKGDPIGYMGNTGKSSGGHLHFELRINGSTVDPLPYLLGEKTIEKKEESKGEDTMEFKVGDVVSVIGTHYYTGTKVSPFVYNYKWKVSQVTPEFVLLDKNVEGTNSIRSPFYAKDLKLEYRKEENASKKELEEALKSAVDIYVKLESILKDVAELQNKIVKALEA